MTMDLFHLSKERIAKILAAAMSRGGDFADIFAEQARSTNLVQEEGILKTASHSVRRGMGIRVVKGQRTGYAYTEIFSEQSMLETARIAAGIAEGQGSDTAYQVASKQSPSYYEVSDPSSDAPLDDKIKLIQLGSAHAHAQSEDVKKATVSLTDNVIEVLMADTHGRLVLDQRPMLRFSVSVISERDGERQQGRSGDGGRYGFSFLTEEKVKDYAEAAVREADLLLRAEPAPKGMFPVILGPGDSGILLHEAVGHPLEADFNRKGTSAYSGRIGEMVADSQCTIIDDGTVANERGSINFDDELNDSEKTVLIEEGRLASYMYDEISARYFEHKPTGNGRRESYKFQPLPRMRTTYMLPGKYTHEEIIASTKKGIFCQTFKGGQVDISNGNFIFVPSEAWLVEDGELKHPVKNLSLIGNGPEAMTHVSMVADNFAMSAGIWTCGKGQQVPVGVGLPTVKISKMTVGGK